MNISVKLCELCVSVLNIIFSTEARRTLRYTAFNIKYFINQN